MDEETLGPAMRAALNRYLDDVAWRSRAALQKQSRRANLTGEQRLAAVAAPIGVPDSFSEHMS